MEFEEFIKEAIFQIVQGVEEAREILKDVYVLINTSLTNNGNFDNLITNIVKKYRINLQNEKSV